jgi:hypothetical protein
MFAHFSIKTYLFGMVKLHDDSVVSFERFFNSVKCAIQASHPLISMLMTTLTILPFIKFTMSYAPQGLLFVLHSKVSNEMLKPIVKQARRWQELFGKARFLWDLKFKPRKFVKWRSLCPLLREA